MVGGFIALVWGADRFVMGAAATAQNLGVSPLVVGLTIVGFGTSAPEMLVSSIAAYRGAPDLSVGNAVGSNIANIALVLGIAALVNPLQVHQKVLRRELPLMLGTMLLALGLLWDGHLGRIDGAVLIGGLFVLIGFIVREGLKTRELPDDLAEELPDAMSTPMALFWVLLGLVVLLGSSELLVWGAKEIATSFGVSERVIGLTVVAFGTSLPELAATVVAAKRNEHEIAVGNVVGSNMFNTLGVLGLPGVIQPEAIGASVLWLDFPVMLGVAVLFWGLARLLRPYRHVSRPQGAVLVAAYVGYLVSLFVLGRAAAA
ncbi:MAG TPA: calcium/sodium antiporter [Polyangiaceae bacterium LLY-WYZ-15_(1-7)]|nr:calcium/sodium antiporter [Polyangiaceae bacterium LLY-WYZ-15_(1-7)]HJL11249.1 calcium/sodium antiporter [Polyangiaceae bacterium LLY-WYZ-15_(1-7)]HJL25716.1 calcium/sodium antiporter [Polyangiaceae bacterium LLY-WYZ-15_(1-7)]